MGHSTRIIATTIGVLLVCRAARAEDPSAVEQRARAYYETGQGQYHLQRYQEAYESFEAGYGLVKRPAFLINMAQAQRAMNHFSAARELLQRYLSEAPANDPTRKSAQRLLRSIEDRADPPAPASPTPPAPPDSVPSPGATVATVAVPTPRPRPWHRDPLGGTLIGLGAALLATGTPLWVIGAGQANAVNRATRYDDYTSELGQANNSVLFQRLGISFVAIGGAVALAGAIRWGVLAERQRKSPR